MARKTQDLMMQNLTAAAIKVVTTHPDRDQWTYRNIHNRPDERGWPLAENIFATTATMGGINLVHWSETEHDFEARPIRVYRKEGSDKWFVESSLNEPLTDEDKEFWLFKLAAIAA